MTQQTPPVKLNNDVYLTDSHCHLLDTPLYQKLPEIIQAAFASDVRQFIVPCSHFDDFERLSQLSTQYPFITPAFGVHPFYIHEVELHVVLTHLTDYLLLHPHALVGEIGLDFSLEAASNNKLLQQEFFESQLALAQKLHRPVIIHQQKSLDALLQSIRASSFNLGGLLHAYSGSYEAAKPWLTLGFKLGIGSVLLKPNAKKIWNLLAQLRNEDFVLETDAPYMRSSNMQQDYNEPKFVRDIAETIATSWQCDWQQIAQISNHNVQQVLSKIN